MTGPPGVETGPSEVRRATLDDHDIRSLFWRSFLLQSAFNYERFQNMGWWWGLKNLLRRWYSGDELARAHERHLVFFNTHPWMVGPIYGIVASMEARRAAGEDIDDVTIQGVKAGMMGPLAGIGDSLFFGAIRPVLSGVAASLAVTGNLTGPIVFLVAVSIVHFATRWYGLKYGYEYGDRFLERMQTQRGLIRRVRRYAVMAGLLVVGALVATLLNVTTPVEYQRGDATIAVQDYLDDILPQVIPLVFTLGVYWLVRKGVNATWIMVIVATIAILCGYFGILAVPAD